MQSIIFIHRIHRFHRISYINFPQKLMRWIFVRYAVKCCEISSPHSLHFLQKLTAFTAFLTKIYPKTSTRVPLTASQRGRFIE